MSIPGFGYTSPSTGDRVRRLAALGRCVELNDLDGGDVVWTAFDDRGEFWLLAPGLDPRCSTVDVDRGEVPGACLVLSGGVPVNEREQIAARGARIANFLPQR